MARLSEEKINLIRSKADIADVMSHYLPLTRKGKDFVCTCPFHDDHNPSMSISLDKQIYKCFVCGEGGNVFTFVQKFENISFVEAVIKVADFAGVELDEADRHIDSVKIDPHIETLQKVLKSAIEYTNYTLATPSANEIKAYLHQRGINDELIQKFQIGYNPKNDDLYRFLSAKKFKDSDLIESNLARLTSNGIHDVFANRILIPIHDRLGYPVGFTARRIEENDEAKYINTGETPCFHKGSIVFNYHRAVSASKRAKRVLVVEGAMDVIAFEKCGISESVATLGTACTKEQMALLKNMHCKIDVCYDGDQAGVNATYKFGKLARSMNVDFEIVDNNLGLDPDEIIDHYGKDELVHLSTKTISWIDFLFGFLQKRYNLDNYSQRKEFAKEMSDEISGCKENFEKENYYKKLYELTQFDMSKSAETVTAPIYQKGGYHLSPPKSGALRAEYEILSQMLISVQAANRFKEVLGFLVDDDCNKLSLYIIDYYRSHSEIEIADFLNYIKEDKIKGLLLDITNWEMASNFYNEDVFMHSCIRIRVGCLEDKIKMLSSKSYKLNDPLEKARLADEIIQLKRSRMQLINEINDTQGGK